MELPSSSSEHKKQQVEIFRKYARYDEEKQQMVLEYDAFIKLISSSTKLYSKFTDHDHNYNQISPDTFGVIFMAVDENNKGYLSVSDWFYFNNLLNNRNYNYIILYEFMRKFDSNNNGKAINFNDKFVSFDELLLSVTDFKKTIHKVQAYTQNEFVKRNGLNINWDNLPWLKFYTQGPPRNSKEPVLVSDQFISLNSIASILQTDLANEKIKRGFEQLAILNPLTGKLEISKSQLVYLLKLTYSHKISNQVFDSLNLTNAKLIKSTNNSINYTVVKDLQYLFNSFDLINQILLKYYQLSKASSPGVNLVITKEDLLSFINYEYHKVNNIVSFSPCQINLLFSIVSNYKSNTLETQKKVHQLMEQGITQKEATEICQREERYDNFMKHYDELSGEDTTYLLEQTGVSKTLNIQDFLKITNPNYLNDIIHEAEVSNLPRVNSNWYFYPVFDSIYNFTLGSVAGAIGATIVYPIDLIKTRMQAQRAMVYKNSIDCAMKVFSKEGLRGLYSGLGPQLIGVAPEKAIKLTVNDLARSFFTNKINKKIDWYFEVLSGACAGACQVVFTNPLEIVKIRLQVQGSYDVSERLSAMGIIRKLGLPGLYKGATACLLRDVPFSAIYFPTYAHIKKDMFNYDPTDKKRRHKLKTWELLVSGGLAGMPAAFLTTPCDVIKTRLQIDAKQGETQYRGIYHAFKTIMREESARSLFKGGGARVLRSSPQFGFTLAAYEIFQTLFPLHGNGLKNIEQTPKSPSNLTSQTLGNTSAPSSNTSSGKILNDSMKNKFFLNYYFKSCQISKTFIDLDSNFKDFNYDVYKKFYTDLKKS
jgi:solute carrier family 25 aspartate/glutamate transporter 12/13